MHRRDVLAVSASALCGVGTGCAGSTFERRGARDTGDSRVASSATPGDSGDRTDASGLESDSRGTVVIGDPDDVAFSDAHPPHELALRNESGSALPVSVEITADGGDVRFERDLDIPTTRTLRVLVVEPGSYTVTVTATTPSGGESRATVGIDRHPVDCSASRTTVGLRETGIQTRTTSRSIACPEPRIGETSIERLERGCATRGDVDGATVEFANETVTVTGRITTPTPCYEPSLATTAYDDRHDALTVAIDRGEQSGGGCIACIGIVDYGARIDLDGRYPGRVDVYHETHDSTRLVRSAEYRSAESE
ncbi:hypothetical protein [Natrinema caseinilyticum]|uniref:hypothetical protein n=1 Tax=Natrinema caseinilyticum TaxID=2961570 RepID=UPI0020C37A3A|nr:hypothetical protein [Natrinema caseinilyticum]